MYYVEAYDSGITDITCHIFDNNIMHSAANGLEIIRAKAGKYDGIHYTSAGYGSFIIVGYRKHPHWVDILEVVRSTSMEALKRRVLHIMSDEQLMREIREREGYNANEIDPDDYGSLADGQLELQWAKQEAYTRGLML